jgi:hypothetical protein
MAKTKAQIAIEKQEAALKDKLDVTLENLKAIEEEFGLTEDLAKLTFDITKQSKDQLEVTKSIIDKTKDVLDNSKKIAEETLTTVDLHKLERQAIAEGLEDRVKIIQKMKEVQAIQKETNRIVNVQANAFKSIGSSIDNMIKSIPGIGGALSDVLGIGDMTDNFVEEFRTSFQEQFQGTNFMDNVMQGSIEGGVSGLVENADAGKSLKNFFGKGFSSGAKFGLGSVATLAVMIGLVRKGFEGGLESMGLASKFKRLIFGSTFDAFKDAFGNLNNASFISLFRSKVLGVRFGVEQTDVAKILRAQTEISGLTQGQALDIQSSIASLAGQRGVLAKDVFSDIAENTELFANFAKDGGQNIGRAAVEAKQLGLSLDTVGKIAESVLDFQSSIEGELKASLLIGRQLNLNRARELSLAGDMAGLQREILSLVGSEAQFNQMNVIQRKALAQALGVTTTELSKLVSGKLEVKNRDMLDNTKAMGFLTQALLISTAVQTGRLLGPGGLNLIGKNARYAPQLGRIKADGTLDKRFAVNKKLMSQGLKVQGGKIVGGMVGRRALASVTGLAFGPIGFGIATIVTFMPQILGLIKKLTGSNDEIASNTKKQISQELNYPLFSSETLSSNASS